MSKTKTPNRKLLRQRELRGWSQQDAADELQKLGGTADSKLVGKWERGEIRPRPYHRKLLCKLYSLSMTQLGFLDAEEGDEPTTVESASAQHVSPSSAAPTPTATALELLAGQTSTALALQPMLSSSLSLSAPGEVFEDCATWFGAKQAQMMALVDQWQGRANTCDELELLLHGAIESLDEMKAVCDEQLFKISRRQALISLPFVFIALGQHRSFSLHAAEELLPQCAASIVVCRHLMQGDDFFVVEQVLAHYRPILETFIQRSPQYRQVAAYLATQCDLLARTLALHRLQWHEREQYSKRAVQYSQLTQNQSLQATARIRLANGYFYLTDPTTALQIYQEALPGIANTSPLTQSSFYVKQAASYAQDGLVVEAQQNLELAHTTFPTDPEQDPSFFYADFGPSSFFLWEGLTLLELARRGYVHPNEAWEAFAQVEGPHSKIIMSERNHVEIINHQAEAALVLGDVDLFSTYLKRGIEGAQRLGSARRLQEAHTFYWQARTQWPSEARIKELAELFIRNGQAGGVIV